MLLCPSLKEKLISINYFNVNWVQSGSSRVPFSALALKCRGAVQRLLQWSCASALTRINVRLSVYFRQKLQIHALSRHHLFFFPYTFKVCQPVFPDGSTCDSPLNEGRYIEDFTCRGLDFTTKTLKEAHLSFPSGHASFTCFTMLYIAVSVHIIKQRSLFVASTA